MVRVSFPMVKQAAGEDPSCDPVADTLGIRAAADPLELEVAVEIDDVDVIVAQTGDGHVDSQQLSIDATVEQMWAKDPEVAQEEDKVPQAPEEEEDQQGGYKTLILLLWIAFMVLTGGGQDYFADFFTSMVPEGGNFTWAAVFLATSMSFLAAAVPPSFSQQNWASLQSANAGNWCFKYKLLLPSLAALASTGLRYVAIVYVSPAVVSILKASIQLVVLSVYKHFRGKPLTVRQGWALFAACIGQIVVSVAGSLGKVPGLQSSPEAQVLGLVLTVGSGLTGALRNIYEEKLMKEDGLSAGGLLMSESWVSLVGTGLTVLAMQPFMGDILTDTSAICGMVHIWPLLLLLAFCNYGKDLGKLVVTKEGDALLAKVLALLYPVVTWIMSLLTFVATAGLIGEGLDPLASSVRLAGFVFVVAGCVWFALLQQKSNNRSRRSASVNFN